MSHEHTTGPPQRRVTKSEACRLLGVSLSTLDRRITEGQLEVERVQQGQVNRVFVLLPSEDMPEDRPDPETEMAVAQERIRSLEELVSLEREWRQTAETRLQEVLRALPAPAAAPEPETHRPWWKLW